jgi:hypothetical protein
MNSPRLHRLRQELEVTTELEVQAPRGRFRIHSAGQQVVVHAGEPAPFLDSMLPVAGRSTRRERIRRFHVLLEQTGLTVDFRCGRRRVARVGREARSTLWSRLARLPGVEIRWPAVRLWLVSVLARGRKSG